MEIEIVSFVETVGLGTFVFYLFRSLSAKINGLEGLVAAQHATIKVMDKRIEETEKIGNIYKNLISDLPADIDNYKAIISRTKDEVILELTNRNENVENKLAEAKRMIELSDNPHAEIGRHLVVLKNLLVGPPDDSEIFDKEYDLRMVSEFNGRSLETSVSSLIKSSTLEEFLSSLRFELTVTEDDSVSKFIFSPERIMPSGEFVDAGRWSQGRGGGWLVIANNKIWLNKAKLESWKQEFDLIKQN